MSEKDSTVFPACEELLLHAMSEGVLGLDKDHRITRVNRATQFMLGWQADELIGQDVHEFLQPRRRDGTPYPRSESPLKWVDSGGELYYIEDVFWRKDGSLLEAEISAVALKQPDHGTVALVLMQDISERKENQRALLKAFQDLDALNEGLEKAHSQLLQSEKMASVGQLAAGVAHEINNPIGFINSNLGSLKGQVEGLLAVLSAYERAEQILSGHAELFDAIKQAKSAADLEFLREDIRSLIAESLEGVSRVKKIVEDLKDFSRVDSAEWNYSNPEQGLESTLNIVWNEIKYKAEVVKSYAGLPDIECIASQINQVFMNLLVNAAQAIEDRGTITLRTGYDEDKVWVEIEDTGKGIKPEHLNRIFEPFFTTKPVGQGTGLGLSLAYGIVQRHRGNLGVRSELGKGTVFRLTLPRTRSAEFDRSESSSSEES